MRLPPRPGRHQVELGRFGKLHVRVAKAHAAADPDARRARTVISPGICRACVWEPAYQVDDLDVNLRSARLPIGDVSSQNRKVSEPSATGTARLLLPVVGGDAETPRRPVAAPR